MSELKIRSNETDNEHDIYLVAFNVLYSIVGDIWLLQILIQTRRNQKDNNYFLLEKIICQNLNYSSVEPLALRDINP